jgi:hypothetical protein
VYPYLPSLFSIYLILISPVAGLYLDNLVNQLPSNRWSAEQKDFIKNVAKDWASRSGFLNAVLAALVSVFVVFASHPGPAIVAALLFIVITVPIGIWIVSHTIIGELIKSKERTVLRWKIDKSAASLCRMFLILMNIGLLILVYLSQSWSATAAT